MEVNGLNVSRTRAWTTVTGHDWGCAAWVPPDQDDGLQSGLTNNLRHMVQLRRILPRSGHRPVVVHSLLEFTGAHFQARVCLQDSAVFFFQDLDRQTKTIWASTTSQNKHIPFHKPIFEPPSFAGLLCVPGRHDGAHAHWSICRSPASFRRRTTENLRSIARQRPMETTNETCRDKQH